EQAPGEGAAALGQEEAVGVGAVPVRVVRLGVRLHLRCRVQGGQVDRGRLGVGSSLHRGIEDGGGGAGRVGTDQLGGESDPAGLPVDGGHEARGYGDDAGLRAVDGDAVGGAFACDADPHRVTSGEMIARPFRRRTTVEPLTTSRSQRPLRVRVSVTEAGIWMRISGPSTVRYSVRSRSRSPAADASDRICERAVHPSHVNAGSSSTVKRCRKVAPCSMYRSQSPADNSATSGRMGAPAWAVSVDTPVRLADMLAVTRSGAPSPVSAVRVAAAPAAIVGVPAVRPAVAVRVADTSHTPASDSVLK